MAATCGPGVAADHVPRTAPWEEPGVADSCSSMPGDLRDIAGTCACIGSRGSGTSPRSTRSISAQTVAVSLGSFTDCGAPD